MTSHKWQFTPRFRRQAFGWKSDLPIKRLKEALSEIKLVAKKEPVLAAEGAITLLEKLSPALEHVDSSSGAVGAAVNATIDSLVPLIVKAPADDQMRNAWLERLWHALQNDDVPYIERLGDYWGDLCVTPERSSFWVDAFLPTVKSLWSTKSSGYVFFKGVTPCLSAMYRAGRYDELLTLLDAAPFKWWHDRRWGVKALVAMGRNAEAIEYAEESRGLNVSGGDIAQACEAILLDSGEVDDAYERYALDANQRSTYLATFRSITKKYPQKRPETVLRDLIESTPGAEGKWFSAAKDAGLFAIASELAMSGSADPRTLIRAARDFARSQPEFALRCGLAGLRGIALGQGYEVTSADVREAYAAVTEAGPLAGTSKQDIDTKLREIIALDRSRNLFMENALSHVVPTRRR